MFEKDKGHFGQLLRGVRKTQANHFPSLQAAISADPTMIWTLMAGPAQRGFETGLKPCETVGKQLYLLLLHLYGN